MSTETVPAIVRCTKCYMDTASAHADVEHPFKVEVHLPPDEWGGNALTFATAADAQRYGVDLLGRWWVPDKFRVIDTRTGATV